MSHPSTAYILVCVAETWQS